MAKAWLAASVGLLIGGGGCAKTLIPNTDLEDTGENRKVVVFCEKYRHALEDKDVAELLRLASPRYFEDGGNTRTDDDYDYEGLRDYLVNRFSKASGIRYEIRYRRITFTEANHVYVDYTYSAAYRIPGVEKEEWRHKIADNRLELVREGDAYKILSGM